MGFISTGNTTDLRAYLTQRGKELLINGDEQDVIIKYFGVGDSDSNYYIINELIEGTVPDLTGCNPNNTCLTSLATNVGIKYNLLYNTVTSPVISKSQIMFQRVDNGQYYNSLDCLVHLDKISRYQLFHSSGNLSNPLRLNTNNALLSPISDLFLQVAIVNNPSLTPQVSDFAAADQMVYQLLFDNSLYSIFNNTYLNNGNTVNQTNGNKSPIELTFSSLNVSGTTNLSGAGKCGVSLYNREIGYLYQDFDDINVWEYYSPAQLEGVKNYGFYVDNNNNIVNQFVDFTIAAKIDAKDDTTGLMTSFIYRGDKNLNNLSEINLSGFTNDLKFANQYAKLFADDYPVINLARGPIDSNTPIISGLMQKEVSNLRDFVHTSGLFNLVSGTTEYRTNKLSFSVSPKNTPNITAGILNIVFKYDNDEVLNGDTDYSHISDEGDINFIEYDFLPTNGIFTNKAKSGTFAKNNCGTGYTGSQVIYNVPAGTYTGVTQTAADTLATNDVNTNGQTYANTHGTCSVAIQYSSVLYSQYVQRNNCGVGYQGSNVLVQYPAGQFTSFISQADANSKAVQAAQIQANTLGSCSVVAPFTGGTGGCLLAGQKIQMDNGEKNIEDIKVGDMIYTIHENNLVYGSYVVEKIYKGKVDEWYEIETISGRNIKCSSSHLFMINYQQKIASELSLSDSLLCQEYGEGGALYKDRIKNININKETVNIYNIEVEDAHTYITENGIWHHNKLQAP